MNFELDENPNGSTRPSGVGVSLSRPEVMRVWTRIDVPDGRFIYDAHSDDIIELSQQEDESLGTEFAPLAHGSAGAIDQRASLVLGPVRRRQVASAPASVAIRHALDHHLTSLVLEVTQQCSMRCRYCVFGGRYGDSRSHTDSFMDTSTARRAVSFFFGRSDHSQSRSLCFYGGEPLLAMQTIEAALAQRVTAS